MKGEFYDYTNRRCLLFGSTGAIGTYLQNFCREQGIQIIPFDPANKEDTSQGHFETGNPESVKRLFEQSLEQHGDVDFILCSYNFEDFRSRIAGDEMNPQLWSELLREWCINQFIILKEAAERFHDEKTRRIVYFHSLRGYTGEGEGEGGVSSCEASLHEAACSGGVTGMMTSIARSIIPKRWSVNGIAYDHINENILPKMTWALHLWLSGMGEYSCGETYRIYK
jgi:hypothetical protein